MQAPSVFISTWLLVAAASVCGCQLLELRAAGDSVEAVTARVVQVAEPRRREQSMLEKSLTEGMWRRNLHWSPRAESGSCQNGVPQPAELRWHFVAADPDAGLPVEGRAVGSGEVAVASAFERNVTVADLREVAGEDDLAGWNAAILLARRAPREATGMLPILERLATERPEYTLRRIVEAADGDRLDAGGSRKQRIAGTMQAAAAEAWCLVLASQPGNSDERMAPAGRALANAGPGELLLQQELIPGIARGVPPERVPAAMKWLDEYRESPGADSSVPVEMRRAVVQAALIHALHTTAGSAAIEADARGATVDPRLSRLLELRHDPDARVLELLGDWAATVRHPDAMALLERQLRSPAPRVRDAALVNLGRLRTPAARAVLETYRQHDGERLRAAAVRGLSHFGIAAIAPAVTDESVAVRRTVAECAGGIVAPESGQLLQRLLTDRSLQVQQDAIAQLASWPDALAMPLLLYGATESLLAARRDAVRQLESRRGQLSSLPFDSPDGHRRRLGAAAIQRQWGIPAGPATWPVAAGRANSPSEGDALHAAEVRSLLVQLLHTGAEVEDETGLLAEQDIFARLALLTESDVPLIEDFLDRHPQLNATRLQQQVLARISPQYAAAVMLADGDPRQRRQAAGELARIGRRRSLTRGVTRLLRQQLAGPPGQERQVWQLVLQSVERDATAEAGALMLLALNHSSASIRFIACEYIGRHRQGAQAEWLVPLLHDADRTVQLAAIRAAGNCGNRSPRVTGDPRFVGHGETTTAPAGGTTAQRGGLRNLLTAADGQVRLAAAVSLAQLGDETGRSYLVRMLRQDDPDVRTAVVGEMGRTGLTSFVRPLIELGHVERDDRVAARIVASLAELVSPEQQPPEVRRPGDARTALAAWSTWLHERRGQL